MDRLGTAVKLPTITIALDYARLSKDRKRLSENVGIQHRENQYFIEDQGWQLGGSFEDNDISASKFGTKTRDDYLRLVEFIRNWPENPDATIKLVIVITEMPRLYRQVEELLPLIKMAEATKLSGIWTTDGEGYDLSTPEGIHRAIGAVNNAMLESNRASKRQRRKKKAQAEQGKYMGGQRRYGFEGAIKDEYGNIINRDRINVAEIPEEVERWFEWYNRLLAGEKQSSIIKDNNKKRIPAPQGGNWTVGNFKRLMTNEAFVIFDPEVHPEGCPCLQNREGGGTLVHKTSGTKHRSRHRGFISPQQHEVLLACFEQQAQRWDHGLIRGRKYLLSGKLLRCGGTFEDKPCGAQMYGNGRTLASGRYQRRYRCKSHNNFLERVACGKVFRDATALDAWVIEQIIFRLDTPEIARALAPQEDRERADDLTLKIMAFRKRRDLIKRQYARGEIENLDDYKFMRSEVDDAIDQCQQELSTLRTAKAANLLPADGKIREAFENAPMEWQRSVCELLIDHVVVHPGRPGSKTWNGRRFDEDGQTIIWRH
jgi:DNA invertase Pin-like site-specific DNA recombinase